VICNICANVTPKGVTHRKDDIVESIVIPKVVNNNPKKVWDVVIGVPSVKRDSHFPHCSSDRSDNRLFCRIKSVSVNPGEVVYSGMWCIIRRGDSSLHALSSKDELEMAVESLEATVNGVLEEHVARARPSPYAKRWRTNELKTLRLR